jgi:hypothetical protein
LLLTLLLSLFLAAACDQNADDRDRPTGDAWQVAHDVIDATDAPGAADGTDTTDTVDARDTTDQSDAGETLDAERDACTRGDCDGDGLTNCEEVHLGTNRCEADSDDDGLSDFQEIERMTDPLDPDSDGDGVRDGVEVELRLDPNDDDTFADGTTDRDRWFVDRCDSPSPEPLDAYESALGNWTLVLPAAMEHAALTISGATRTNSFAADVYADPAHLISGFTLSRSASPNEASPLDVTDNARTGLDGIVSAVVDTLERGPYDIIDGTATTSRYRVELAQPMTPNAFRDALLFELAPFKRSEVTGLPSSGNRTYDAFVVRISPIVRAYPDGTTQVILTAAVAPFELYQSRMRTRHILRRLTDATNIGDVSRIKCIRCSVFPAPEVPEAEMYWVVDPSNSMDDDIGRLRTHAVSLFEHLDRTRVDYRVGVATMAANDAGRLVTPPAWHNDAASFDVALDQVESETNSTDHDGFVSARQGLDFMSNSAAPQEERLRRANVMTVFLADEEAQTFQDHPLDTNRATLDAHIAALSSYGDIISITTRDAESYRIAGRSTDGAYTSIDTTASADVAQIVRVFSANQSTYKLPDRPLSGSIRVFLEEQWVPPSDEDGWSYDPVTNAISFHGNYRPAPWQSDVQQGYVNIVYSRLQGVTSQSPGGCD